MYQDTYEEEDIANDIDLVIPIYPQDELLEDDFEGKTQSVARYYGSVRLSDVF